MNLRTRTAALTLAVPLGLGLLVGCGDDAEPTSSGTASDPVETSEPTTPTEPSSDPTTDPVETTEPPTTLAAPVYFTGDTPFGPRLYREFRPVETDNPLEEAAALLVAGDAVDPDYGSLLQGVAIESVSEGEDAIVVTLAADSVLTADKGLSADDAAIAVQSLVYTLQGVAQSRAPLQVVLADGSPVDLFGQPTSDGVEAADELDVLSLVNLTTPEEGAAVGDSLTVEGVASSFEATVPFYVTDADGAEVLRDFTTAEGWVDKLYPFTAEVDLSALAPGDYTLHAETDDPSGGEGPGPFVDTKTFTVG